MSARARSVAGAMLLAVALAAAGCSAGAAEPDAAPVVEERRAERPEDGEDEGMGVVMLDVNGASFEAELERNEAAETLAEMLAQGPLTVVLSDYGGFEKVGALGASLPASDRRTTTSPGDVVLYQGDQIVAFYGSNTWAYTRLARVTDTTGWAEALGSGDVELTLSLAE